MACQPQTNQRYDERVHTLLNLCTLMSRLAICFDMTILKHQQANRLAFGMADSTAAVPKIHTVGFLIIVTCSDTPTRLMVAMRPYGIR